MRLAALHGQAGVLRARDSTKAVGVVPLWPGLLGPSLCAPSDHWLCLPFSVPLCSGDTGSAPCWMVQDSNWLQPGSHIVHMFLSPLVGRTFYREGSPESGVKQGGGLEEE